MKRTAHAYAKKTYLLSILLLMPYSLPATTQQLEEQFNSGIKHLKNNQLELAANAFEKVIRLQPNCAQAYFNLGLIYLAQNYNDTSIAQFEHDTTNDAQDKIDFSKMEEEITVENSDSILFKAEVSVGELIDKITILRIKNERINDIEKLKNIRTELRELENTLKSSINITPKLNLLIDELLEVNKKLWDIEDEIRNKERLQQFDSNFISLARSVYITNDKRCTIKRAINNMLGSRLVEEKSYANYQSECTNSINN